MRPQAAQTLRACRQREVAPLQLHLAHTRQRFEILVGRLDRLFPALGLHTAPNDTLDLHAVQLDTALMAGNRGP